MPGPSSYHLFSLPDEILQNVTLRALLAQEQPTSVETEPEAIQEGQSMPGNRACNVCLGVTFTDVDDQRLHFRSDWHRYNVKTRLKGGKSVTEGDFATLVERMS